MIEAARKASQFAYIVNNIQEGKGCSSKKTEKFIGAIAAGVFFRSEVKKYVDERMLTDSCIEGGFGGILFLGSSFMKENEDIIISAVYRIKIPVPFFQTGSFGMIQKIKTRGFVGEKIMSQESADNQNNADVKDKAYITISGTVYHKDRNCSHIDLTVKEINIINIESYRNSSGGKYKKCHICSSDNSGNSYVYIARSGDRFHFSLGCSGLKRTVLCVEMAEVINRRPCSRCAEGKNQ